MCNLSKGLIDEGIAIGIEKSTLKAIQSLMNNLSCTAIQAMTILDFPLEDHDKYLQLLHKSNRLSKKSL